MAAAASRVAAPGFANKRYEQSYEEKLRQVKMLVVRFLFKFVWVGTLLMLFVHTEEFIGEQDIVHWATSLSQ